MMSRAKRQIFLLPLLAVMALLAALTTSASAAFDHDAPKTHYGNFSEWEGEWLEESPPEPLMFSREKVDSAYDCALGVDVYVRQNPWSKFDPYGLWEEYSDEDREKVRHQSQKSPEQFKQDISTGSDFLPLVGTGKGITEVFSVTDPVTNKKLSGTERTVAGIGTFASVAPGGKIGVKYLANLFKKSDDALGVTVKKTVQAGEQVTRGRYVFNGATKASGSTIDKLQEAVALFGKNPKTALSTTEILETPRLIHKMDNGMITDAAKGVTENVGNTVTRVALWKNADAVTFLDEAGHVAGHFGNSGHKAIYTHLSKNRKAADAFIRRHTPEKDVGKVLKRLDDKISEFVK